MPGADPPHDRLHEEQRFHDDQATARAYQPDDALRFADEAYLDHETWIRPALAELGDWGDPGRWAGRRLLDYGCGHGMAAVVLARRGARVTGFDLSPGYLREAARRARANGVALDLVCADGERLPFADGAFDAVWGNAVLHHLDLTRAAEELRRVLAPGGVAVFCEPWGDNPLLAAARRWLPYPGKARTPDERPLTSASLRPLRAVFPGLRVQGHQLLGMVRRLTRPGTGSSALLRADERLLRAVPGLWRLCRYAVLTLPRDG